MLNLRGGISSLIHRVRADRAAASGTPAADRPLLEKELNRQRPDLADLTARISRNGVAAVTAYWTAEKCAAARQAFDRVLRDQSGCVQTYSGGSDRRLYGMETADPLFADFHQDLFLKGFGELDGGLELYNFATLGGHVRATAANTGSGDGWHRDAHGYQFKAILYLSDTGPKNGPFQYILGSHARWRIAVDTAFGNLPEVPQTRYTNAEIDQLAAKLGFKAQPFPAPAGTLLLVNTAGIHRGMPLESGERYALTNYYYRPGEIDEARIAQFSPLLPGTAERVRRDLLGH